MSILRSPQLAQHDCRGLVRLIFTMFYIVAAKFYGMPTWFFGVSAEGIGTLGMILNFIVTIVISRLTPPPPAEIQALVEDLRDPTHVLLALADIGEEQLD